MIFFFSYLHVFSFSFIAITTEYLLYNFVYLIPWFFATYGCCHSCLLFCSLVILSLLNWKRDLFTLINYFSIQHEASRRAGQADGKVQPGPLPQETKVYCARVRGPGSETHSQVIVCDMWTAYWTLRLQELFSFHLKRYNKMTIFV